LIRDALAAASGRDGTEALVLGFHLADISPTAETEAAYKLVEKVWALRRGTAPGAVREFEKVLTGTVFQGRRPRP
jgi:hypothetical protein